MNLPDPKLVEDAEWQLKHATEKLAPHLEALQALAAEHPGPRADKALALLRALAGYFESVDTLTTLLSARETEMNEEMARAEFIFRQMRLDRDFYLREAQVMSERYYHEQGVFARIQPLLPAQPAA